MTLPLCSHCQEPLDFNHGKDGGMLFIHLVDSEDGSFYHERCFFELKELKEKPSNDQ